jgi:hypothetical protein
MIYSIKYLKLNPNQTRTNNNQPEKHQARIAINLYMLYINKGQDTNQPIYTI